MLIADLRLRLTEDRCNEWSSSDRCFARFHVLSVATQVCNDDWRPQCVHTSQSGSVSINQTTCGSSYSQEELIFVDSAEDMKRRKLAEKKPKFVPESPLKIAVITGV